MIERNNHGEKIPRCDHAYYTYETFFCSGFTRRFTRSLLIWVFAVKMNWLGTDHISKGDILLPETFIPRPSPVTLIHHAAHCDQGTPPSSPKALEQCLNAGAKFVEIDVLPLADGSFALIHDRDLSVETSGTGDAIRSTRAQIESLTYRNKSELTDVRIGFLEDAVAVFSRYPNAERLQLDLKPYTPLTLALLRDFSHILSPIMDRVQVTSVADWAVRSLRQFAPDLSLGFDPLLYLDIVDDEPRPEGVPPFRVGAYGLRDDHPLGAYRWGQLGEYLAARAGALLVQVPGGCQWFIRADLLKMVLKAGFDWIDFLHQNGSTVDGWTINADVHDDIKTAQYLIDHGIDALTTDTPARLADQLAAKAIL